MSECYVVSSAFHCEDCERFGYRRGEYACINDRSWSLTYPKELCCSRFKLRRPDVPKRNLWVPVEKQLPDEDVKVLVCCKTKKGVRSVNMAYLLNGFWHGQGSMAGVTHWMPLPEMPEEVEHE